MAKRTTRAEQKEATRAQLLEVAREAFSELGFEGTTIREIARRAGVATGTVFVHFPDKHALLADIFQAGLTGVLDEAWRTLPSSSLKAQLLHLARHLYGYYAERPALARVLVKESLFMTGEPGERLEEHRYRFLERVGALFAEGKARGELNGRVEVMPAVRFFFGTYFSVLVAGLRGDLGEVSSWIAALDGGLSPWLFDDVESRSRGGR